LAYKKLHELAFEMPVSPSGFPQLLSDDVVKPDQPYHLFERSVDWQAGGARLYVGARKADVQPSAFLVGVDKIARQVQAAPQSLDAAICCATGDWIVWWDHAPTQPADPVMYFDGLADRIYAAAPRRLRVPPDLTEPYAGISLKVEGDFVNLQFPRL
jgi:hypothetical protein